MLTIEANIQKIEATLKIWNGKVKQLNMNPKTVKQHLLVIKTKEYQNAYDTQLKDVYSKMEEIQRFVEKVHQ